MSDLPEYTLDRSFAAPRELVWRAWTDPELLNRWYGPGADTVIHEFELEPGGCWLNEMRWGETSNFQKVVFLEVDPPAKMVWQHHSSTDAEWNDAPNPMMPDWPRVFITTVTFTDRGERTDVRLSQVPHEATDAEIACFTEAMSNMDGGWGSGYAMIDEILAELQAG